MTERAAEITLRVVSVLEELAIDYAIGGSLASSLYGSYRATQDSDLVADIQVSDIASLVERLKSEFYVSAVAALEAVTRRSSFNLIHLETSYKIDIFVPKQRDFDRLQLRRATPSALGLASPREALFCSAEDTILAKLEWYRLGGEVSDRQWSDVRNMLRVQGDGLDRAYMREMAVQLGVLDLLDRAE
ncbi:MAG: hypothetical protein ACK2UO_15180, partial [Caldilineaceae bacterium]